MAISNPKITVFSRSYCHLCDEMLAALEDLRGEFLFDLEVVDIDIERDWQRRYDELVPVVVADGRELCHYFLDEAKLREYLGQFS